MYQILNVIGFFLFVAGFLLMLAFFFKQQPGKSDLIRSGFGALIMCIGIGIMFGGE